MNWKEWLLWGFVIFYWFLPVDIIPEIAMPLIGFLDDVVVTFLAYKFKDRF